MTVRDVTVIRRHLWLHFLDHYKADKNWKGSFDLSLEESGDWWEGPTELSLVGCELRSSAEDFSIIYSEADERSIKICRAMDLANSVIYKPLNRHWITLKICLQILRPEPQNGC